MSPVDVQSRLASLRSRFYDRCRQDGAGLMDGVEASTLHRLVHRIAGVAGTFGEAELGRLAAEIEDRRVAGELPPADMLDRLVRELTEVADRS